MGFVILLVFSIYYLMLIYYYLMLDVLIEGMYMFIILITMWFNYIINIIFINMEILYFLYLSYFLSYYYLYI